MILLRSWSSESRFNETFGVLTELRNVDRKSRKELLQLSRTKIRMTETPIMPECHNCYQWVDVCQSYFGVFLVGLEYKKTFLLQEDRQFIVMLEQAHVGQHVEVQ